MTRSNDEPMAWLADWYRARCDGDWEHQYGIRIGTLDNPGWSLDVDLAGTPEAGRTKKSSLVERSDSDWLFCEANEDVFRARGGPENLGEVLGAFQAFVCEKDA